MSEVQNKKLVVFLDTVGRTIIGERVSEEIDTITIKNPAVVNIIPQQAVDPATGQPTQRMALQLFPLFFREFLAAKDEAVKFVYNKKNITLTDGDVALDFKVSIQYEQLFVNLGQLNVPEVQTPKSNMPQKNNVIQLFDKE